MVQELRIGGTRERTAIVDLGARFFLNPGHTKPETLGFRVEIAGSFRADMA